MDVALRATMRPTGVDRRAAVTEFGLTTAFLAVVFGVVRWGTGTMAAGATVTELRGRVVVVSALVGLVIVGFAVSPPGRFSGAHMNPAITLGLFAAGAVPARRVVPYLAAQGAGSIAAAVITRLVWGPAVSGPAVRWSVVQPGPGWTGTSVAVAEAATLAVVVATMCWVTAHRPAWHLAWIVGGMFGLQGAALGTLTGGSANPVRQLGPALFSGEVRLLAVYLIAPVVGGMLAGWTARGLRAGPRLPVTPTGSSANAEVPVSDGVPGRRARQVGVNHPSWRDLWSPPEIPERRSGAGYPPRDAEMSQRFTSAPLLQPDPTTAQRPMAGLDGPTRRDPRAPTGETGGRSCFAGPLDSPPAAGQLCRRRAWRRTLGWKGGNAPKQGR